MTNLCVTPLIRMEFGGTLLSTEKFTPNVNHISSRFAFNFDSYKRKRTSGRHLYYFYWFYFHGLLLTVVNSDVRHTLRVTSSFQERITTNFKRYRKTQQAMFQQFYWLVSSLLTYWAEVLIRSFTKSAFRLCCHYYTKPKLKLDRANHVPSIQFIFLLPWRR